jgi:hypothetical protein
MKQTTAVNFSTFPFNNFSFMADVCSICVASVVWHFFRLYYYFSLRCDFPTVIMWLMQYSAGSCQYSATLCVYKMEDAVAAKYYASLEIYTVKSALAGKPHEVFANSVTCCAVRKMPLSVSGDYIQPVIHLADVLRTKSPY